MFVKGTNNDYEIVGGKITVKAKKTRWFEKTSDAPDDVIMPTRKTKGSACYDFYLCEDVELPPRSYSKIIPTYIKAKMPQDEVLLLHIRSSIGLLKHVVLCNNTGIIDSDYADNPENEGNIGLALYNYGDEAQMFHKGDRIMQGMFVKYGVVDNDVTTGERKGGTGSTGV